MLNKKPRAETRRAPSKVLNEFKDFRLHPSDKSEAVVNFYSSLDTPVALSCFLLWKYEENDQLVTKEIDPRDYIDGVTFRDDFAAVSFLRKNSFLKTSFDLKDAALSAFESSEDKCRDTNKAIKTYLSTGKINPVCEAVISMAIRKIARILGPFEIDTLIDSCGWGPGVTLSVKGDDTSAARKFDVEGDITRDAYHLFAPVMQQAYPLWMAWSKPRFVTGNRIITVPKNAKTDRTIAVEPGLNSWIQHGIGKIIRRRLRQAGYNLDSDARNQRGALLGSLYGELATVDFKAASDTITTELVRLLLPPDWFVVLDAARSQFYTLNGETHLSAKFSSMGNGFTFELESLIFLALALATCGTHGIDDQYVSIFGDDLIAPIGCKSTFQEVFKFAGFTMNLEKTFFETPFRESCGTYYFNGIDVKPYFLKEELSRVKSVYRMANAIRNLSHRHAFGLGCDSRFRNAWQHLVDRLPKSLRLMGPVNGGDAVIHGNMDESNCVRRAPGGWEGFLYPGLPEVPLDRESNSLGLLLAKLSLSSKGLRHNSPNLVRCSTKLNGLLIASAFVSENGLHFSKGNAVPLRRRTRPVFKRSMFVDGWYNFGPWLTV